MSEQPPTALTGPHRRLHDLIRGVGLAVEDEVQVGRYTLDCYLGEVHAAVEYDGPLHRHPKQRAHDRARDVWLYEQAGIPVLRVREDDDWRAVPERVREFVEQHASTTELRQARGWRWLP